MIACDGVRASECLEGCLSVYIGYTENVCV